jgi:hypothetical protein
MRGPTGTISRPVGTCACGKKAFDTRSAARKARKLFRRRHATLFVYHSVACAAGALTSQPSVQYSPRAPAALLRLLVA